MFKTKEELKKDLEKGVRSIQGKEIELSVGQKKKLLTYLFPQYTATGVGDSSRFFKDAKKGTTCISSGRIYLFSEKGEKLSLGRLEMREWYIVLEKKIIAFGKEEVKKIIG